MNFILIVTLYYSSFLLTSSDDIPHTPEAIRAMQEVANFFVNEARKNKQSFVSLDELQQLLIYNYCPVNHGYDAASVQMTDFSGMGSKRITSNCFQLFWVV